MRRVCTVSMNRKGEGDASRQVSVTAQIPKHRLKPQEKAPSPDPAGNTPNSSAKKRSSPKDLERNFPPHTRASTPTLLNVWDKVHDARLPRTVLQEKYAYAFTLAGQPREPYKKKFLDLKAKKMATAMARKQRQVQNRGGLNAEDATRNVAFSSERAPARRRHGYKGRRHE
ncbi:hypothetical protein MPH_08216 [Macrophomina phaseolina MS6]|uniref:Uncharacterized protein n=1 Tax=Macrophomina phaseolina (strain MS6) TaxID=1126212 RepID=K2QXJ8_MACPH|nr:hypothetical protein MPH_08216 [Macrophomina phaseolina MS6]